MRVHVHSGTHVLEPHDAVLASPRKISVETDGLCNRQWCHEQHINIFKPVKPTRLTRSYQLGEQSSSKSFNRIANPSPKWRVWNGCKEVDFILQSSRDCAQWRWIVYLIYHTVGPNVLLSAFCRWLHTVGFYFIAVRYKVGVIRISLFYGRIHSVWLTVLCVVSRFAVVSLLLTIACCLLVDPLTTYYIQHWFEASVIEFQAPATQWLSTLDRELKLTWDCLIFLTVDNWIARVEKFKWQNSKLPVAFRLIQYNKSHNSRREQCDHSLVDMTWWHVAKLGYWTIHQTHQI